MNFFKEKQWFNQWWMLLIHVGLFVLLGYMLFKWFVMNEAVDKVAADDRNGQLIVVLSILISSAIILIFRLTTVIDENGVHIRFFPFHRSTKHFSWYDIDKCYTRKYSPISEFGGWGLRIVPGGKDKAYNIKGNQGIQIELKNGKRILIGTQKPEQAEKIIKKYFKK